MSWVIRSRKYASAHEKEEFKTYMSTSDLETRHHTVSFLQSRDGFPHAFNHTAKLVAQDISATQLDDGTV